MAVRTAGLKVPRLVVRWAVPMADYSVSKKAALMAVGWDEKMVDQMVVRKGVVMAVK